MKSLSAIFFSFFFVLSITAQDHGAPREWTEILLEGIRNDFARPTVHARNLYHMSMAMYDAWAVYDTTNTAEGVLIGNTLHGMDCPVGDFPFPSNIEAAREEAICYAAYRFLAHRFDNSPAEGLILSLSNALMAQKGYSLGITATTYQSGIPGTMGNYIASCIIDYGLTDNSNQQNGYVNQFYQPVNPSLFLDSLGNDRIEDYNRWQPLTFDVFIDQSGMVIPGNTPPFLSPEWGSVFPFSLSETDVDTFQRDGFDYLVYHDPGPPPYIDTAMAGGMSEEYKWGFGLVSKWSSHLDPADTTMWDISPASIGNIQDYPTTIEGLRDFYDEKNGGDPSIGRTINPFTGAPYAPQLVKRADYARVLAEFWADGPDSETPPGHWFTILNYVLDHPDFVRKFNGTSDTLSPMEYEAKAYLTLGGTLHDVAVAVWGMKGWYDYIRPISAIRAMTDLGQSSDPNLMSYHPGGILLDTGYIELILPGDVLAGANDEHVGKIKIKAWKGPEFIIDPDTDIAGVDWIRAEAWWPYQRPTFVTPNFAGYVSGHSTFSRAAAEVMTALTGSEYFPGGMGIFEAPKNEFLVFEEGPSDSLELQWATYRDASDQCSLSRIWGGIHPPVDDIPGRLIGIEIGTDAFNYAREIFYNDNDNDGFYNYEDCDDENENIFPGAIEVCDGLDNNCDGQVDEGLDLFTYYLDKDEDEFGDENNAIDTCLATPPVGYVANALDCNDQDSLLNPNIQEICDGIDNDCNGMIDDGLTINIYYLDQDEDGFGDAANSIDSCALTAPMGYVDNDLDCNDQDSLIHPNVLEICDGIDNDCSGISDDNLPLFTYFRDSDTDGFGDPMMRLDTCVSTAPIGYVTDSTDCDDTNMLINTDATDIANNGIDEDCDGEDFISGTVDAELATVAVFPNPFDEYIELQLPIGGQYDLEIFNAQGMIELVKNVDGGAVHLGLGELASGVYMLSVRSGSGARGAWRVVKL